MKRGPYRQGDRGATRPPGAASKQLGPPNLYPARAECECNRPVPDEDGICVMCGHYTKGTA